MIVGKDTFVTFLNDVGKETSQPVGFAHWMSENHARRYTTHAGDALLLEPVGKVQLYRLKFRNGSSQLGETEFNVRGSAAPILVDGDTVLVRADGRPIRVEDLRQERRSNTIVFLKSKWGDTALDGIGEETHEAYCTNAAYVSRLQVSDEA